MSYTIFGLKIDNLTKKEAIEYVRRFLLDDSFHYIVTLNPEGVVIAHENEDFKRIVNQADLVVADGSWLIKASRFLNKGLKERIAGIDLLLDILKFCSENHIDVYLLGAKEEVVSKARENLEAMFSGISIVGFHSGYFDYKGENDIIEEIKRLKPGFLVVGLGMPKQELWMSRHRDLPVRLAIGVGGSFDVLSGMIPRAPRWMQSIGMEWLYRVIQDPKRFKRLVFIPRFFLLVLKSKLGII
jgi:N-acetylglucosaminyldiphosphoundecaprenol N-acetyl-beta-D-mannosaminyltransferase